MNINLHFFGELGTSINPNLSLRAKRGNPGNDAVPILSGLLQLRCGFAMTVNGGVQRAAPPLGLHFSEAIAICITGSRMDVAGANLVRS